MAENLCYSAQRVSLPGAAQTISYITMFQVTQNLKHPYFLKSDKAPPSLLCTYS